MLWTVKKHFENGTIINELIHSDEPITIEPIKDKIISSVVSRHVYKIEFNMSPTLHISDIDGKKYIIPMWIEVHPETTMNDIKWTRPKEKKIVNEIQGSMGVYKTTYDPNKKIAKCTCMGYFRARMKGGVCKHIKALKEKQCQ
jgi:hypothetical protein